MTVARRWRRKPAEVEAAQVTADNLHEVAAWAGGVVRREGGELVVRLPGSMVPAHLGDYIARSVLPDGVGPAHSVKPDVHEAFFELADEPPHPS